MSILKIADCFPYSAGFLLTALAVAKIFSSWGDSPILQQLDPITLLPFRDMFLISGTLEIGVALACFFARDVAFKCLMVAWLASTLMLYRSGLWWIGYHKPCSCLGSLTKALGISPESADTIAKSILGYLLIGGYASFVALRSRGNLRANVGL